MRLTDPMIWTIAIEGTTAIALLVAPALVVRLLLGSELAGSGIAVARIAGITIFSLVVACRPRDAARAAVRAMFAYNALVGVYLASLGMSRLATGAMLWPAVAIHAVIAIALARRSWK